MPGRKPTEPGTPGIITKLLTVLLLALLAAGNSFGQDSYTIRNIDRERLAEAFRIGDTLGDQVWKDWQKAPFAVLLVSTEHEFLLRHPQPSSDFTLIGYDPLLKSNVYFRRRTQPIHLLATFPAVAQFPQLLSVRLRILPQKPLRPG